MIIAGLIFICISLIIVISLRSKKIIILDSILLFLSCILLGANYFIDVSFSFQSKPIIFQIFFVWVIILVWFMVRKSYFSFNFAINYFHFGEGVFFGLILGFLGIIFFLNERTQLIIINNSSDFFIIGNLLFVVIQKAVAEEVVFRMLVLNYLKMGQWREGVDIFIQGIVFAFIHVEKYQNNIGGLLFTFLFGLLAGYLAIRHKNIIGTSIMHIIANLIAVIYFNLSIKF